MSDRLSQQLLAQAEHLARKEPNRPQQASLRRAVSAAYYALFHFLIDQACRSFLGTANKDKMLRRILARGFQHRTMNEASKSFAGGTLPGWVSTTALSLSVPADLTSVAAAFVRLQEERHRADYSLGGVFTKNETLRLIAEARAAMDRWDRIKNDDAGRLYLLCLLCWNTLKGR